MVKRFRRSAAGHDQQLPSDLRPPAVLQRTLNYLLDEVVGGPRPLAAVHKFVWDRTRSIRNDFSIQQVSRLADVRLAVDCYERIARFHLVSLHQLSNPETDNAEFDAHQEREQLDNTLLTLIELYDLNNHRTVFPNEPEFRAYAIIMEILSTHPDGDDRAQRWPRRLLTDPRIEHALRIQAAAFELHRKRGPLRPEGRWWMLQNNYVRFWALVGSARTSYLLACAAERFFNLVRTEALGAILAAYRRGKRPTRDLYLSDVSGWLGYDTEEQTITFLKGHHLELRKREDGPAYLNLGAWRYKNIVGESCPIRTSLPHLPCEF